MRPIPAIIGLAVCAALLGSLRPALAQAQARSVSVVVLSERSCCWERPARLDAQLKRELAAGGVTVQEGAAYYQDLSAGLLAQYQVVVAMYPPTASGSVEAKRYLEKAPTILDWVRGGGGLLVVGDQQYRSLGPPTRTRAPSTSTVAVPPLSTPSSLWQPAVMPVTAVPPPAHAFRVMFVQGRSAPRSSDGSGRET
jgi:hypothetical protein